MSLPRYPKYKDSGVEWLGEVPEHWELSKIKHVFEFRSGGTPSKSNLSYWDGDVPWASSKDLKTETLTDTVDHITEKAVADGASLLEPGTLLVVVRGMILAHSFPVTKALVPMAINQDLKGLTTRDGWHVDYAAYALRASAPETFRRLDEAGHGTKALRMEAWGGLEVPRPTMDEQVTVAGFLDGETAKIDALVAEQERLIELLQDKRQAVISHAVTKGLNPDAPMKDSGIEWLGEIPAYWTLPPVYARYEQALGKMLDQAKLTGLHPTPYLRNVDVRWDFINTEDLPSMDIAPHEVDRFTVRFGDLLMVEGRELGRSAIWKGSNGVVGFQKALHRLRARDASEHARFFYYTMVFAHGTGCFLADQSPNEIPHLTGEELRRYRFPKPPFEEQVAIVATLDRAAREFDGLIVEAERAIDLLQERRTALISAAVTGQIDVRPAAARRAA